MSVVVPLDLLISLVRYHLYEAIAVDGMEVVPPEYLAGVIGNNVTSSFVLLSLHQLAELNEVTFEKRLGEFSIQPSPRSVRLTPQGTRKVEAELRDKESLISRYRDFDIVGVSDEMILARGIPASDRIVDRADNQTQTEEALALFDEIEGELASQSNEIGEAFGDERELALAEVRELETIVSRPRFRAQPFLDLARKTLGWI